MKERIRENTPSTNGVDHTNGAEHTNGLDQSADATIVTPVTLSAPAQDTTTYPVAEPGTSRFVDESQIELMRPRRNRWRIAIPALLLIAVAVAAAYYFFLSPPAPPPTATVQRGTIISTVETTGKLEAQTSATLSFRQSGQVARVIAKQGDQVKEGDVLAELDTADLQRQLDNAKAQLEISKLKLQQAKEGPQAADIAAATADLNGATAALNQTARRRTGRGHSRCPGRGEPGSSQARRAQERSDSPGHSTGPSRCARGPSQA